MSRHMLGINYNMEDKLSEVWHVISGMNLEEGEMHWAEELKNFYEAHRL